MKCYFSDLSPVWLWTLLFFVSSRWIWICGSVFTPCRHSGCFASFFHLRAYMLSTCSTPLFSNVKSFHPKHKNTRPPLCFGVCCIHSHACVLCVHIRVLFKDAGMMRRLCANAKPIFHLINSGESPHVARRVRGHTARAVKQTAYLTHMDSSVILPMIPATSHSETMRLNALFACQCGPVGWIGFVS